MAPKTISRMRNQISDNFATYGAVSFYDRGVFLALSPLFILNSALINKSYESLTDILLGALSIALALAVCIAYSEIAVRSVFSKLQNHTVYLLGIAIFGFTVGGLLEVAKRGFSFLLGLDSSLSTSFLNGFIRNGILGTLIVFATTGLVLAQRNYKTERATLVAEQLSLLALNRNTDSLDRLVREALSDFVTTSRQDLLRATGLASDALRQVVEQKLRPLSHRLWERNVEEIPSFAWSDLIRHNVQHNRLFPAATAAIYFVTAFPILYFIGGFLEGFRSSFLGSLVIFVALAVAKVVKFKDFKSAAVYYTFLHIAVALAVVLANEITFGPVLEIGPVRLAAVTFLFIIEMNLLFGLVSGMKGNSEKIRQDLIHLGIMKSISRDAVRIQNQLENRELANFLHGNLQNSLLASAARLENLPTDSAEYRAELSMIVELLGSIEDSNPSMTSDPLGNQLESLKESWKGMVDVVLLRYPTSTGYAALDSTISRVISEGLTNAVRHGHATNIEISVLEIANGWQLRLVDDGLGPTNRPPGLGTKLFDSLAPGDWDLSFGKSGGSVLTLNLVADA